jgi:hypothetical protein
VKRERGRRRRRRRRRRRKKREVYVFVFRFVFCFCAGRRPTPPWVIAIRVVCECLFGLCLFPRSLTLLSLINYYNSTYEGPLYQATKQAKQEDASSSRKAHIEWILSHTAHSRLSLTSCFRLYQLQYIAKKGDALHTQEDPSSCTLLRYANYKRRSVVL